MPKTLRVEPRWFHRLREVMAVATVLSGLSAASAQNTPGLIETPGQGDAVSPALQTGANAAPPPLTRASGTSVLHLLPAGVERLRFSGETDSHVFAIFLSGAQAHARARIHLSYTNAVSVMPEASRMTVSVNDVTVSDAGIASSAANGPVVLDVDIPENVLQPGYNAVRIAVQQRHRVECSLGATYELWTQLDPANTGLAFAGIPQETITDLSDLPALAPSPEGIPIRLVLPKGLSVDSLDRSLRAMEAVVLRGGFGHAAVDIVEAPQDRPGLDLLVGTTDELRQAGFTAYVQEDQPIAFRAGARPGESTLVVSGLGVPELETAIGDILKGGSPQQTGALPGLRAVALAGTPIQGRKTISFRDLGINTQEFSGHLFQTGFDLLMPPDFYPADYGKMTLRINAGYVAGLDPTSQLLVRVNDRDAASLALRNPNGDVFRDHPVTVSLADLRPGYNHVQIEAQVSEPADKACDASRVIDAKQRFVLLDDSELQMPDVARIAHMPSLSATGASGFPYVAPDSDTRLFVPHPDRDTISAVANFLARAARAAGAPLAVKIVISNPAINANSALIVGAFNDIPAPMVQAAGLDAQATRDIWSNVEARSEAAARLDRAREKAGLKQDGDFQPAEDADDRQNDVFQKWSANVTSRQWRFDPVGWAGELFGGGLGLTRQSLTPWARTDIPYVVDAQSRLVIAQHAAPEGGGATWTLITAPTSEFLARSMQTMTDQSYWDQLDGRISAFIPTSTRIATAQPSQGYFIRTAPLSPGNLRLIAAGWLSSYLEYYVLALVVLSLCLGVVTTAIVRRSGLQP